MEPFSQLLNLLRLQVEIYHNYRVCGQWLIQTEDSGHACFHMATQGEFRLQIPGYPESVLNTGDLVIFSREVGHVLKPVQAMTGEQRHLPYADAQDLQGTSLLCGRVDFQHRAQQQLLESLPQVFIVRQEDSCHWQAPLRQLILDESMGCGSGRSVILNRLSELLLTYALRHFVQHSVQQEGVLGLYGDIRLRRALADMHEQPDRGWTLQELASRAGMSRTVFAETFKQVSGWTPMQYLGWWRMQLAWSLLQKGEQVAQVAEAVGYRSDGAFSRAFKQAFGVAAGAVRRQNAQA